MEFASSLAQSAGYGVQAETSFGASVFTLPVFERSVQYGYPNTGWVRAINNEGAGLPNYFTWLNAWNSNPPLFGTIRQGFSQSTSSVSPFIDSTLWDSFIVHNIYDSLMIPNPLASSQLIDWMVTSEQQLLNSQLTYTPPTRTVVSFRFTLRNDLFFQDGRPVTAFDASRQRVQQAAEAAPAVQASPGDVVTVVEAVSQITTLSKPASLGALQQVTSDVSQTINDVTGQNGLTSTLSHPTNESQGVTNVVQTFGVIRIIFKLP